MRPAVPAETRPGCIPGIRLNHAMRPDAARRVPECVPCMRPVRPGCDFVTPDARTPELHAVARPTSCQPVYKTSPQRPSRSVRPRKNARVYEVGREAGLR